MVLQTRTTLRRRRSMTQQKQQKRTDCQVSIPKQDLIWLSKLLVDGCGAEIEDYIRNLVEDNLHKLTSEDIVEWLRDRIDGYDEDSEKRDCVEELLDILSGDSGNMISSKIIKQVKEQLALDLL